MLINERILYIDINNAKVQSAVDNFADYTLYLTAQGQYVLKFYCYDSIFSTPVIKNFQAGDTFYLVLGYKQWNITPLVKVIDPIYINQISDWSSVDPLTGKICFKISLNVPELLIDISGSSNKTYTMQIWCENSSKTPYIVASCPVNIKNITVEI